MASEDRSTDSSTAGSTTRVVGEDDETVALIVLELEDVRDDEIVVPENTCPAEDSVELENLLVLVLIELYCSELGNKL